MSELCKDQDEKMDPDKENDPTNDKKTEMSIFELHTPFISLRLFKG